MLLVREYRDFRTKLNSRAQQQVEKIPQKIHSYF
jgi:hypothetical protein